MPHWFHSLLHWLSAHWGDWVHSLLHWLSAHGNDPAWLAVAVAAFFGVVSWRSSRRSQAEANRATQAAKDAVSAANRLADAGERSATADETQAQLAQDKADAAERYPWDITPDGYRLINKRNTPKYNVYLSGDRALPMAGRSHFRSIDGGGSVPITLLDAAEVVNKNVVVRWHPTPDHTGESWKQRIEP